MYSTQLGVRYGSLYIPERGTIERYCVCTLRGQFFAVGHYNGQAGRMGLKDGEVYPVITCLSYAAHYVQYI